MSGMKQTPNASLLLIPIQEAGHIPSMSTTDAGIHKRKNLQPLSFGEAPILGLVLMVMEMETLSSGGIRKGTIKYLLLTTHHTP